MVGWPMFLATRHARGRLRRRSRRLLFAETNRPRTHEKDRKMCEPVARCPALKRCTVVEALRSGLQRQNRAPVSIMLKGRVPMDGNPRHYSGAYAALSGIPCNIIGCLECFSSRAWQALAPKPSMAVTQFSVPLH
ncbi:hypothetical protein HPB50_027061 [Hyalomma asiaticum]|uniref:Uncharacterized protein n=1 Tax=Hyalomma asiaticum TaxID=266040 RepID=A0ACB7RRH0_HYAAI|nr:hypothetical protein HPB50_027061 [Hyalomma asiaticum]